MTEIKINIMCSFYCFIYILLVTFSNFAHFFFSCWIDNVDGFTTRTFNPLAIYILLTLHSHLSTHPLDNLFCTIFDGELLCYLFTFMFIFMLSSLLSITCC